MEIKKQLITLNFTKGGNKKKYIVVHDTGNKTDTAAGNAKYFQTKRESSAHYFVDDKEIIQLVLDEDKAWHAGKPVGDICNSNSIGIEMCRVNDEVTAITEEKTLWLVKELMAKHKIPVENVVRHFDASGKNCPSAFSKNDWAKWKEFKKKLGSVEVKEWKLGDKNPEILKLQELLNKKGALLKPDGDFGGKTELAVVDFQTREKLPITKKLDKLTQAKLRA